MLLVPVTGVRDPGNYREYRGNWQKGNISTSDTRNSPTRAWALGSALLFNLYARYFTRNKDTVFVRSFVRAASIEMDHVPVCTGTGKCKCLGFRSRLRTPCWCD